MNTNYIDVDGDKWGIVLITDYNEGDKEFLAETMRSFGMREKRIGYALKVIMTPNCGLCITNSAVRMSAVFISRTTSKSQFFNSIAHEMTHVASAITEYYDEPCDGESMAYLTGYLMQRVLEEITELNI